MGLKVLFHFRIGRPVLLTEILWEVLITLLLLTGSSCGKRNESGKPIFEEAIADQAAVTIEYAKRFQVSRMNGYTVVEVNTPFPGSRNLYRYILKNPANPHPLPDLANAQIIPVPVRSLVCYSTSHLPALEMLHEEDKLTGFPDPDYIYSPVLRKRVQAGKIKNLGPSNDINLENLISLNPGLVMAFSIGNDLARIEKINGAGIPVVINADYMENTPLGRAEWLKFTALFFGKTREADSIFNSIRDHYNEIKMKVAHAGYQPVVLTGIVYGDAWFLPGGRNYASAFLRDAGASYPWASDTSEGNLQVSFEAVYEKASNADVWIGTSTYESREALKNADARYAQFRPFKNDHIYNYSAKVSPQGGNDYFETGYSRPDWVLLDLACIFHPEIIHDHALYFYRKIN